MKRLVMIMGVLLSLIASLILSIPTAASGPVNAPRIHLKNGTSLNWAGYAVETNLNSPQSNVVTDVQGSWVVPTVTDPNGLASDSAGITNHGKGSGKGHKPPTTGSSAYSAAWVGIDGYSDGTVEQIGTEQDWYNGAPRYYAWFEMYPRFGYQINAKVSPGDNMNAEVKYLGQGVFNLTLNDYGSSGSATPIWHFSINEKSARAERQSAEWIMEAPSSSGGVLPLADFTDIGFTGASAILNGHSGTISDTNWQNDAITMTTSNGTVKAQPSSLSPDGSSFSVIWYHN